MDRARSHRLRRWRDSSVVFAADPPDLADRRDDYDLRLLIEGTIANLSRRQREVVVLYYLADLSIDEAAEVLGLRPGSVKAHLAAARARLKSRIERT